MAKLQPKSCPHCGNLNKVAIESVLGESFYVICWACHSTGPKELTKLAAVEAWNRRRAPIYRTVEV